MIVDFPINRKRLAYSLKEVYLRLEFLIPPKMDKFDANMNPAADIC